MNEQARERAVLTARELRRRRLRRIALVSAVCVGLPTLLAVVHYGFLASAQYDSVAVVAMAGDARQVSAGEAPRDLDLVRRHMLSRAAMDDLDRQHGLAAHYQDSDADFLSRLDGDAGRDELYDYYRSRVHIPQEPSAAALTVRVRAFSPEKAQELAAGLIASAARFLDQTSAQAARDVLAPAEQAVADARKRMALTGELVPAGDLPAPEEAALERELAREQLASALRGLEAARLEAARRQRHLVVVAPASLPDSASEPRPLWSVGSVFLTTTALMGVLWLLIAAVREHSRF